MQDYIVIKRDRLVGRRGGVASFIRKGIGRRVVDVNEVCQALVLEVFDSTGRGIKVVNFTTLVESFRLSCWKVYVTRAH